MIWNLKSDRPIYLQLLEHIELSIISGVYKPGDKLPSVRDLAEDASVNPNTMQKALVELERSGLVYTQRTTGRFITEDRKMIENLKRNYAKEEISAFFEKMKQLGFSVSETIDLLQNLSKELNL